jgi:predicted secreted hydrolase
MIPQKEINEDTMDYCTFLLSRFLRRKKVYLSIFLIFLLTPSLALAEEYRDITENTRPEFPQDFFFQKNYRVQWWYFTGHLFDASGKEFGYELTFFAVGVQKREYQSKFGVETIYMSHFAISDVEGKRYYFGDMADSGTFNFAGSSAKELKFWIGKNVLEGTIEKIHIKFFNKKIALDLVLMPRKPVVLHGDGGYSRKSEESPLLASIYFSCTNLETKGTVRVGDTVLPVHGKSWFDREISTRGMSREDIGWDWFAIQLNDGREFMLSILRKKDGTFDKYSSGTVVYRDGRSKHLLLSDFRIRVLRRYKSKKTGAEYPAGWEVKIPSEDLDLNVVPLIEDQEFLTTHSTGNYYWEGTCSVEGTEKGRAYIEMTGY